MTLELRLNSPYLYGADQKLGRQATEDPGTPADCTLILWRMLASCGVLVSRVSSIMMANGQGNWRFPECSFAEARAFSVILLAMDYKKVSHAGMLVTDVYADWIAQLAHASSSRGFIKVIILAKSSDYFFPRISKILQINYR